AVIPNVPNVVYTPTLFQSFGQAAAQGFGAQVEQVAPNMGSAATAAFNQAFQAASAALAQTEQQSLADFNSARATVLANTAAAIYSSPLGQALSAAGISEAAFNANLQTQYQSFAASATSATTLLNSQTTAALNQVGGNIVRIDTDRLFADMLASPERYGLANTTAPACSGSTAQSLCQPADAAQADSRLFADGFHPGPAAHQIMADYIINTLQAPQDMAALRRSVMEQSRNVQDFVREESNRQRSNPQAPHTLDAIAAYQRHSGDGHSIHAGAKAQFNENWQAGAVFSRSENEQSSGRTDIEGKTNSLSGFIRYDQPRWWLGGLVQINDSDYTTRRHFNLGQAALTQSGDTSGNSRADARDVQWQNTLVDYLVAKGMRSGFYWSWNPNSGDTGGNSRAGGLFGGYDVWQSNSTRLSALADLTLTKGKINGFAEQGSDAARMQFGKQNLHSLQSGLGFEVRHQSGSWQPFANLRWVKEWKKDDQGISAGLGGSHFYSATPEQDRSWLGALAGVQWQPQGSPLHAFAAASRDFGHRNQSHTGLQIGIGARF
ncbi:MAG TPA: autotransporter domain-containing protein, partial [Neisseria sp.]|nr:autotransporter domain-containing protein [Neisseria sp.]